MCISCNLNSSSDRYPSEAIIARTLPFPISWSPPPLVSDPNAKKLTVEVLKEAIRKIKSSSTWQYAALRVGGKRRHLLDQVEAVLPAYEAQDWSFVYKP